jgi:hypothetical protein
MAHQQPDPDDLHAKIKPLASTKADGTPYERPVNAVNCVARYLGVPESVRITDAPRMPSEALGYFIRNTEWSSRGFYERLFQELLKRVTRIIHETTRGLPEFDAADLTGRVAAHVMEMIVSPEPTRRSEMFEVHFRRAVEAEALDALRVHMRAPLGALRLDAAEQVDDDGDAVERPLEELVSSGAPGPEDTLLVLHDTNRRHQLLRTACRAVPNRLHLKAAILRWGYDWPIESSNPKQRSLVRQFGVSKRTMIRWLDGAMKAMRAALAMEPEMIEAQTQRLMEAIDAEITSAVKGEEQ